MQKMCQNFLHQVSIQSHQVSIQSLAFFYLFKLLNCRILTLIKTTTPDFFFVYSKYKKDMSFEINKRAAITSSALILISLAYTVLSMYIKHPILFVVGFVYAAIPTAVLIVSVNMGLEDMARYFFDIPISNDSVYKWLGVFIVALVCEGLIVLGYTLQTDSLPKIKKNKRIINSPY